VAAPTISAKSTTYRTTRCHAVALAGEDPDAEIDRLVDSIQNGADGVHRRLERGDRGRTHEPWFQRAFSEVWRHRPEVVVDGSEAVALREFLVKAWIDEQIAYHRATADRCRRRHGLWASSAPSPGWYGVTELQDVEIII
jgi:hypothetical protein